MRARTRRVWDLCRHCVIRHCSCLIKRLCHLSLFLFDLMLCSPDRGNERMHSPPFKGRGWGGVCNLSLCLTPPRPMATPPLRGVGSLVPPPSGGARGGASRFCSQNYNIPKPCCLLLVVSCSLRSFFLVAAFSVEGKLASSPSKK